MHLLLAVAARLLDGFHAADCHYVAEYQRAGLHHLLVRGLVGSLAEVQHEFRGQGFL